MCVLVCMAAVKIGKIDEKKLKLKLLTDGRQKYAREFKISEPLALRIFCWSYLVTNDLAIARFWFLECLVGKNKFLLAILLKW